MLVLVLVLVLAWVLNCPNWLLALRFYPAPPVVVTVLVVWIVWIYVGFRILYLEIEAKSGVTGATFTGLEDWLED